jgi:hypothetical protein
VSEDAEVAAITQCVRAMGGLDRQQQAHVLAYLTDRYDSLNGLLNLMTQGLEQLKREASEK